MPKHTTTLFVVQTRAASPQLWRKTYRTDSLEAAYVHAALEAAAATSSQARVIDRFGNVLYETLTCKPPVVMNAHHAQIILELLLDFFNEGGTISAGAMLFPDDATLHEHIAAALAGKTAEEVRSEVQR